MEASVTTPSDSASAFSPSAAACGRVPFFEQEPRQFEMDVARVRRNLFGLMEPTLGLLQAAQQKQELRAGQERLGVQRSR